VFIDGKLHSTLRGDAIVAEFLGLLDRYVETNYPPVRPSADPPTIGLSDRECGSDRFAIAAHPYRRTEACDDGTYILSVRTTRIHYTISSTTVMVHRIVVL